MEIRLWNAFASNNSGSYTIVGHFMDPAVVKAAIDLLRPVLVAHDEWRRSAATADTSQSPLAKFAVMQGLPADCVGYDWPEYHGGTVPQLVGTDHQLLVHHSYTQTLPRFFGYWMYALGGRVTTELEHAHAPVVVTQDLWAPWRAAERERTHQLVHRDLAMPDAGFRVGLIDPVSARLMPPSHNGVRLVAIYEDMAAGCEAVREVARRHGVALHITIHEADSDDPLNDVKEMTG